MVRVSSVQLDYTHTVHSGGGYSTPFLTALTFDFPFFLPPIILLPQKVNSFHLCPCHTPSPFPRHFYLPCFPYFFFTHRPFFTFVHNLQCYWLKFRAPISAPHYHNVYYALSLSAIRISIYHIYKYIYICH